MKEPLVSIIIPLYNAEKYLEQTISSVLNQTYDNWELIIVNDCSKDNSLSVAQSFEKKNSKIKVYANDSNQGVSYTRNRGISLAEGKYIALLDADDFWHVDKLKTQITFMEENNILVSYSNYTKIKENGEIRGEISVPKKMDYNELLKNCMINCITGVYRNDLFKHITFKKTKVEDYIFWLEMFKEIDFAYGIQKTLAYYRVQDNSRSSNKIDIVKQHWYIYRNVEKLSLIPALYYFSIYLMRGILRFIK